MDKQTAAKQLLQAGAFFVAYAQATNMPYVTCDEESFDDEVHFFAAEEDEKNFAKSKRDEKIMIMGMKVPKSEYTSFFSVLYAMGIDTIDFYIDGEHVKLEMDQIVTFNMDKLPEEKRPLLNQSLQLSGLYFMQELRMPVENDQRNKEKLKALEEEVIANLRRSDILMAVEPAENRFNIPCMKNREQKPFQPFFTDSMEAEKFTKGKKLQLLRIKFMDLSKYLLKEVDGFAINPLGFNLILSKEQIENLTRQ